MRNYHGMIEDVLFSGEYDQGDNVVVSYDELYDLAEQGKIAMEILLGIRDVPVDTRATYIERRTNRPLHPSLGGRSPYSEFLRQ